jgi:predicted dinucleotide-binding enzyme
MKIGIIGAGFIGRALATLAVKSGHEVMLSNSRAAKTLGSTAIAIDCKVGTALEAAGFGEVAIVAIPLMNYAEVPVEALVGKIVMDANNYYPERDGRIEALDTHATTTSELLSAHLAGAKVVKAFNAILQGDLEKDGRPAGSPDRRALPIAGDDAEAKRICTGLIDQFGFDVVDAGPLAEGWQFQRAMPAYCIPLAAAGLQRALAAAERGVELPHGSWRPTGLSTRR